MKDELEVQVGDEVLLNNEAGKAGTVIRVDAFDAGEICYDVKRFDGLIGCGVDHSWCTLDVTLHRRKGATFAIGDIVERRPEAPSWHDISVKQHCEVVGYTPRGNVNLRRLEDGYYSRGHSEISLQIVAAKSIGPAPLPAPATVAQTVRPAPEDIHYFSEGEFLRSRGVHLEVHRAEYMSFLRERESGIELMMQNPYHDKEICMHISTEAAKQLASDIVALALSIERGEV